MNSGIVIATTGMTLMAEPGHQGKKPSGRKPGGKKARRDRDHLDLGRDIDQFYTLERTERWDEYLRLAGAPKFQEALAVEAARAGEADVSGPLRVLDDAIGYAIALDRIPDAAGLALARA